METLDKCKLALRKYILENKEEVLNDLDRMIKMSNTVEIKFVDEYKTREVEKIGIVQCIRSDHDASWEFPVNSLFNLYKQEMKDDTPLYIVFNDTSGWYAGYRQPLMGAINLSDKDFEFKIVDIL
jgi:hypothetical protein